jgi:competence protein ComEA
MTDRSPATLLLWAAAAGLAVLAVLRFGGGGGGTPNAAPVRVEGGPSPARGRGAAAAATLVVHVAGEVRRPGVVRVRPGARVAGAVRSAGGATGRADLNAVNLAARLEDGQQVVVPAAGAAPAGQVGGPGTPGAARVSLGTATVEQLDELDGIGPTLAQRIVDYRTQHGGFGSLAELRDVEGIGEKRMESLREAVQP